MMKRSLLLAVLAVLGVSAHAQTPAVIAHAQSSDASPVVINAAGANTILLVTDRNGGTPTDTAGDTFTLIFNRTGFDTDVKVWAAMGITGTNSETISVAGGYGTPFVVVALSNIASFDKSVWTDLSTDPQPTTATPVNPNEMAVAFLEGLFGSPPSVSVSGTGWSMLDTNTGGTSYSSAYSFLGASTAPNSMTSTNNSNNGFSQAVLLFTSAANPLPLTVTPSTLPPGMRTAPYPQTAGNLNGPFAPTCITPSGGAGPYVITMTGTLPPGLSFDGHCVSGTPTTTGTYSGLIFHVVDHAGATVNTPSMSIVISSLNTTLDLQAPNYGFVIFPGARRHPGVLETNPGATGRVNWSLSDSTKATISCTTDCAGTVTVTATGTAGACSITGTVGNYHVTGGNDFTLTATSRDQNEDGSYSSASETYHICKGDHVVDVQPSYNQAFFGQEKITYGYTKGQIGQGLTWTCTAPDNSSCNAALDVELPSGTGPGTQRHNRSVTFKAPSVIGSYKLTACGASDYDGTQACNYEWIYVGGPLTTAHTGTAAFPISPEGTEVQACFPDPRFGARSWTVKADGTGDYTHLWQPILDDAASGRDLNGGFLVRVFNQDTTGANPTQYPDFFYISDGGTRDVPSVVCGVPDASGHLPIQQRQGVTGSGRDEGYYGTIWEGNLITVAPRNGGAAGFDTGFGPDNVYLWGIFQKDSAHYADSIGVEAAPGSRHLVMEGMHSDWLADGALLNNNTYNGGRHYSEFNAAIGGHYENCGDINNSQGSHCLYMESMYPLIANNLFSGQHPGGGGLANKIRGGGSIVASNSYLGSYGYPVIAWPAMTDTGGFTSVDNNLGVPGDANCGDSAYCTIMAATGDENWLHMAANEQALAEAYVYGNIFSQASGAMYGILQYGAQNINQCNAPGPDCTNGIDHTGGLYIWNNTFDREGGAIGISSDVIYNNTKGYARPVRTYPWLYYQNNSMFNAGLAPDGSVPPPFQLDMAPYFQGRLQNNLIATGSLDLSTPIIPGHTGWSDNLGGNGDPIQPWTAYSPKDSYLTGLSTTLTTSTIPYNTTTFKPTTGSPLIGAGAAIAAPEMALLPLILEPDPVNGYVIRRTDSVSTIGARSSGVTSPLSITTASLPAGTVGTPYSACLSATGGTTPYTWTQTGGSLPAGLSLASGCITGTPLASGTSSGLVFHVVDAAAAAANSASLSIAIAGVPPPTLSVTTTSLPSGTVGTAYRTTLSATGGTGGYTWTMTGTLPAGLTFVGSTGVISGTPTSAATFSGLVFTVRDSSGTTAPSSSLSITIAAAAPSLSVTTTTLPSGALGVAYTSTLSATGGTAPYVWTMTGTLPAGVAFNGSTGVISGTPTNSGTFAGLVFTAHDAASATASSPSLTITISGAAPPTPGGTSVQGNVAVTGNVVLQ